MKSRFLVAAAALFFTLQAQAGAYVINSAGSIYCQQTANGGWKQLPGQAKSIACNKSGSLWVIGLDSSPYHWNGKGWDKVDGSAVRIAVDPSGNPWVINDSGDIYQRVDGAWQKRPGKAKDIAIGEVISQVFVIGYKAVDGGDAVYQWSGSDWQEVPGHGAVRVTVHPAGFPMVIDAAGASAYNESRTKRWIEIKSGPPGVEITSGLGTCCMVGKEFFSGTSDHVLYRWDAPSQKWVQMDGYGVSLAVF